MGNIRFMNLRTYMKLHNISDSAFSAVLGCSAGSVRKWRFGERMPEPEIAQRIVDATEGSVTVQDLHDARMAFLRGAQPPEAA